jgi:hypothetical protein
MSEVMLAGSAVAGLSVAWNESIELQRQAKRQPATPGH